MKDLIQITLLALCCGQAASMDRVLGRPRAVVPDANSPLDKLQIIESFKPKVARGSKSQPADLTPKRRQLMGKGMGGKGMSKGKGGKGKGKMPKTKDDDYYDDDYADDYVDDAVDDGPFFDDAYVDDKYPSDGCQIMNFNETFVIPPASLFLAPDTTPTDAGTPSLPGTLFIFEHENILEPDGVTLITGTRISGTCTRTTIGSDGGGVCEFVFVDDEDFTINVEGYLQGPFGSPLAITGGTGGMVGVIGEMDIFPIYPNGTSIDGDIFLDALRYEVIADLGLIVCP